MKAKQLKSRLLPLRMMDPSQSRWRDTKMAYDDRFYFGMAKIVVKGGYGSITATDGDSVFVGTIGSNGVGSILVPHGREYIVANRDKTKTAKVMVGYGDCVGLQF